jgi:AcrR family transcriptional regulator
VAYLRADERRRRIIDAAIEVIASEGLSRTTTRRIADRADAPLGALHYCFENKDELLAVVFDRGMTTLRASFAGVEPQQGVEAVIRTSVSSYWGWVRENLGLHLALMEMLMVSIRSSERGEALYTSVNDPFGAQLMRENLTAAAQAEGSTTRIPIPEIVRYMIHRFDGLVFELAASNDEDGCQRQTELLADALVALAGHMT